MIRDDKFKYIHRYPDGPYEFYDLQKDPNERINKIDDIEYLDIIKKMRYELLSWYSQHVNPEIDGATLPVYGGGQKGLAGKWGKYDKDTFGRYSSKYIFTSDNKSREKIKKIEVEDKIQ